MRIKKKNIARLASFSALGAGALGVAAGTAQGATVPIISGTTFSVGLRGNPGSITNWNTVLPSAHVIGIRTAHATSGSGQYRRQAVRAWGTGVTFLRFATGATAHGNAAGPFLDLVTARSWNQEIAAGVQTGASAVIGIRRTLNPAVTLLNPGSTRFVHSGAGSNAGNFTDQYALFRFATLSGFDYGWLNLSGSNPGGSAASTAPQVSILGGEYDDSGNPIAAPAGIPGNCSGDDEGENLGNGLCTPEPSTMVMFGFAALAWGATGLRRWRAARKPAA